MSFPSKKYNDVVEKVTIMNRVPNQDNAVVRYTLDESVPDKDSPVKSYTICLNLPLVLRIRTATTLYSGHIASES